MKKTLCLLVSAWVLAVAFCGCSGLGESAELRAIRSAPAAKLETADGAFLYVDSEIDLLKSFADLEIHAAPLEPDDREEDWIYRITFNPSEKVSGGDAVAVSFHSSYVQVNSEYYLADEGVAYDSILGWAQAKFDSFFADAE